MASLRLVSLAIVAALAPAFAASAQTVRPNIVLIIMDDVGVELLDAYNHGLFPEVIVPPVPPEHRVTPNIDDLAQRGVLFRNVWSAPLCVPSRAALISGLYAYRTGVVTSKLGQVHVSPAQGNLPSRLGTESSYGRRHAIGKWHISPFNPASILAPNFTDPPTAYGFTEYEGDVNSPAPYQGYAWVMDPPPDPEPEPPTDYLTTAEVDAAIDFVEQSHTSPWFLWLALHAAHDPWFSSELPTGVPSSPCDSISGVERKVRCRQLEIMDAEIARLVDALADPDLLNTTVILLGDNGSPKSTPWMEMEIPEKVNGGSKNTLREGGINVPLIIAGKHVNSSYATTPAIEENGAFVHIVDVTATILDLAGVTPGFVDGVSLRAQMNGSPGTRPCLYTDGTANVGGASAHLPRNHDVAIRDINHKLIRLFKDDDVVERGEGGEFSDGYRYVFYNLASDPRETTNLVDDLNDLEFSDPGIPPGFNALRARLNQLDVEPPAVPPSACQPTGGCGMGAEVALPLVLLYALRRRWRARRR